MSRTDILTGQIRKQDKKQPEMDERYFVVGFLVKGPLAVIYDQFDSREELKDWLDRAFKDCDYVVIRKIKET